jgi:hypothetical protein
MVNAMTDRQLLQIVADYEQFERDSFIGDCLLRSTAEKIKDTLGDGSITFWMERVALETYRNFAERFIQGMDDGK